MKRPSVEILAPRRRGKSEAMRLLREELIRRGYEVTEIVPGAFAVREPVPSSPSRSADPEGGKP